MADRIILCNGIGAMPSVQGILQKLPNPSLARWLRILHYESKIIKNLVSRVGFICILSIFVKTAHVDFS